MAASLTDLRDFETHPAGPVATLEPAERGGERVWYLRAGYEYGELNIWGRDWAGYRATTPEEAQAAADTEIAARHWPRTGPWEHGRLLNLANGGRDEVWQARVDDTHIPWSPLPDED